MVNYTTRVMKLVYRLFNLLVTCMYIIVPLHTQLVLLRVENTLLLTTLVRFTSSLRLDQLDLVPHHVPGSAILRALLHILYSGRHLLAVLSPQHHQYSHKLLVMCYTSLLLMTFV